MRRRDSEHGSILLAMLAIIAIGGMASATFAMVRQSQFTTRRDISYTEAIQVADAGVQQALTYLSQTETTTATVASTSCGAVTDCTPAGLDTSAGGGTFTWIATRNGFDWEVRATGTVNDVSRTVEALIGRPTRFFLAAFGDQYIEMIGGNNADSFNSETCTSSPCPRTNNGAVGSNGTIELDGNAEVDGVFLYGPDATCEGADCDDTDTEGGGSPVKIDVEELHTVMEAEAELACPEGPKDDVYQASVHDDLEGGETYCFSEMILDDDVLVLQDGSGTDKPATVYVFTSGINAPTSANGIEVNCEFCEETAKGETGNPPPRPQNLLVNVLQGQVSLNNQSHFAWALVAPRSQCVKSGSNAQTDIYGSMLCRSIANVGGWQFHYDDALNNVGIGLFDIKDFREEVGSSTSFN